MFLLICDTEWNDFFFLIGLQVKNKSQTHAILYDSNKLQNGSKYFSSVIIFF